MNWESVSGTRRDSRTSRCRDAAPWGGRRRRRNFDAAAATAAERSAFKDERAATGDRLQPGNSMSAGGRWSPFLQRGPTRERPIRFPCAGFLQAIGTRRGRAFHAGGHGRGASVLRGFLARRSRGAWLLRLRFFARGARRAFGFAEMTDSRLRAPTRLVGIQSATDHVIFQASHQSSRLARCTSAGSLSNH